MSFSVYVLQNPERKLYIGVSENAERRLSQHNDDRSHWSKEKGPWRIIWKLMSPPSPMPGSWRTN